MTFITLGKVPDAITGGALSMNAITARLSGLVFAYYLSTVVSFEHGLTTSYGNTASITIH